MWQIVAGNARCGVMQQRNAQGIFATRSNPEGLSRRKPAVETSQSRSFFVAKHVKHSRKSERMQTLIPGNTGPEIHVQNTAWPSWPASQHVARCTHVAAARRRHCGTNSTAPVRRHMNPCGKQLSTDALRLVEGGTTRNTGHAPASNEPVQCTSAMKALHAMRCKQSSQAKSVRSLRQCSGSALRTSSGSQLLSQSIFGSLLGTLAPLCATSES